MEESMALFLRGCLSLCNSCRQSWPSSSTLFIKRTKEGLLFSFSPTHPKCQPMAHPPSCSLHRAALRAAPFLGLPSSSASWTPGRNKAIFWTGDFLCSQTGISIAGLFILAQGKARRQISWLTTWGDWLKQKTSSGCCYGYCFWLQEIWFLLSNNDLAGLGRPAGKRVEACLIPVQRLRMMVHAMVTCLG